MLCCIQSKVSWGIVKQLYVRCGVHRDPAIKASIPYLSCVTPYHLRQSLIPALLRMSIPELYVPRSTTATALSPIFHREAKSSCFASVHQCGVTRFFGWATPYSRNMTSSISPLDITGYPLAKCCDCKLNRFRTDARYRYTKAWYGSACPIIHPRKYSLSSVLTPHISIINAYES